MCRLAPCARLCGGVVSPAENECDQLPSSSSPSSSSPPPRATRHALSPSCEFLAPRAKSTMAPSVCRHSTAAFRNSCAAHVRGDGTAARTGERVRARTLVARTDRPRFRRPVTTCGVGSRAPREAPCAPPARLCSRRARAARRPHRRFARPLSPPPQTHLRRSRSGWRSDPRAAARSARSAPALAGSAR